MANIEKDNAYFLHQTPYRDNSALVHLFTRGNGKVSFVVSGLKNKKNAKGPFLQACQPLLVSYQLKTGLSKLTDIDFSCRYKDSPKPSIKQFMFYQYANELLLNILPAQLPAPTLFDDYQQFLQLLGNQQTDASLRYLEIALITLFNGLPELNQTQDSQLPIDTQQSYYFCADKGLFAQQSAAGQPAVRVSYQQLMAFRHLCTAYFNQQFELVDSHLAHACKAINHHLIAQLLNGKSLKTRTIYKELQKYT